MHSLHYRTLCLGALEIKARRFSARVRRSGRRVDRAAAAGGRLRGVRRVGDVATLVLQILERYSGYARYSYGEQWPKAGKCRYAPGGRESRRLDDSPPKAGRFSADIGNAERDMDEEIMSENWRTVGKGAGGGC